MQNHCLYKLHDFMQQYETIYSEFSGYSAMARLYFAVANTENISLSVYLKYMTLCLCGAIMLRIIDSD